MRMERIVVFTVLALAGGLVAFSEPAAGKKLKPWQKRRGTGGGLVVKVPEGPGLQIINAQRRVPHTEFERMAFDLTTYVSLPWKAVHCSAAGDAQKMSRAAIAAGAAGVVAVVDEPDAPALVVAPEEGWSAVNVARLADGGPQASVFSARLRKELWRAAAWAVGGGNSSFQPCLLRGVTTMAELDAIPLQQPGPEPNNKMIDEAHRRGVQSVRFASYRQACIEGWAPAPTNDVQKAIWEKVQAEKERGPAKPITIPPPKK